MADKSENNGEATEGNLPAKSTPKDALVMSAILKEMGISEYEPRVINQMLEFTYRYITTVLEDAQVYCKHAGKKELDAEDVQLAIQSRLDHSYTNPPPREFLIEIARQKNRHPLPQLQAKSGLRLPPDRYCLTSTNYKVKAQKKHSQVRANSLVTRTLSQSSALPSTPASIKTTTATIITVKMPTTATPTVGTTANTTALTGSSAVTSGGTVMIKKEPPSGGSSVLLMKAAGAATAAAAAAAAGTKGTTVAQVKTQPAATGANKPSATGTETPSQAGTTGNPMSMLTVSALPSMDETVASTQQPLIGGLKRKHEDEDDDYDS